MVTFEQLCRYGQYSPSPNPEQHHKSSLPSHKAVKLKNHSYSRRVWAVLQGLEIPKVGSRCLYQTHNFLSYISNDRITFTSVITPCENKWMSFK